MTTLLVLRERIKKLYAAHSLMVNRIARGLFSLVLFYVILGNIGFMERLNRMWLPLVLALPLAFLPNPLVVILTGVFVLLHLYAVSLEVLLVFAVLLVVLFCFYYVFQPGDSLVLLLVPILLSCRLPFLIPILLGLLGTVNSMIPAAAGVILYYTLSFIKANVSTLAASGTLTMAGRFMQMITGTVGNRTMWMVAAATAAGLVAVWVIRRLPIQHAWRAAAIVGALLQAMIMVGGGFIFDIEFSYALCILNVFVAIALGLAMEFWLFHQDYSRTEYVQFEDDDYYYFVKAVPKISMTQPERTVQTINGQSNKEYGAGGEELFTLHPDPAAGSELVAAGQDLEQTRIIFEETPGQRTQPEAVTEELPELPEENRNQEEFEE